MALRCLAITFMHVPWTAGDESGIGRRFRVFLHALHRLGATITLLHLVPPAMIDAAGPLDALSDSQSAFWGVPLRILMEARQSRRQTAWNHYGAGILDARQQPFFFPYAGEPLAQAVGRHLDTAPDLVFAHRLQAMLPVLRSGRRPKHLVLDLDDIEHILLVRNVRGARLSPGKPLELLQVPALMRLERRAIAASDLAFLCSETDRAYLARLGYGAKVVVAPNALPVPPAPPAVVEERSLLFLGDMQRMPNRMAAERLLHRIWPLVLAKVPQARLLLAGRASEQLRGAGAAPAGVEFLGFVGDLDALYARSRVVCCPIMTGSGTRLKLVEAAGYARPIVSTRMGAEGLDFPDGEAALLRDDDAGFAAACVALLQDDALCRSLGDAARRVMQATYDADKIAAQITAQIAGTTAAGRA